MRKNVPVTTHERLLKDGDTLVSTTDLKGRITYANPAFIAISGFSEEELLGQPHNIVRHPDMPEEAFADLWETIGAGRPWTALVKNRSKNGDFYWVRANVTPIMENARVVGYMSVRTRPDRHEIAAADRLYRDIRDKRAKGIRISGGLPVRTGFAGAIGQLQAIPVSARIALVAVTPAMAAVIAAAAAGAAGPALASGAAVALGGAVIGVAWLRLAVVRPLQEVSAAARKIASGQLNTLLITERRDELGTLVRDISQAGVNVMALVADVKKQVQGIETATAEIARGSLALAGRTEQSVRSLQQTATGMEEVASAVRDSASHADQASRLAGASLEVVSEGTTAAERVNQVIADISVASRRIGDITGLIDDIAFQTNLLSLNAAVEAARAGESGRGFAVVASEVRTLAQRSAAAAREIKQLTADNAVKVDTGSAYVRASARTMQDIEQSVRNVSALIEEIAQATRRQTGRIDEMSAAVVSLDSATAQNAALAEECTATAGSLKDQSHRLAQAISVFRVGSHA